MDGRRLYDSEVSVNVLGMRRRYWFGGVEPSPEAGAEERSYIDFTVDGVSLEETLCARRQELIGILEWGGPMWCMEVVEELLLRANSIPANGRQLLYACHLCRDLGCGGITAHISRSGNEVVWSRFGYENNWDQEVANFDSYEEVGPFRFEYEQYEAALQAVLVRKD